MNSPLVCARCGTIKQHPRVIGSHQAECMSGWVTVQKYEEKHGQKPSSWTPLYEVVDALFGPEAWDIDVLLEEAIEDARREREEDVPKWNRIRQAVRALRRES